MFGGGVEGATREDDEVDLVGVDELGGFWVGFGDLEEVFDE